MNLSDLDTTCILLLFLLISNVILTLTYWVKGAYVTLSWLLSPPPERSFPGFSHPLSFEWDRRRNQEWNNEQFRFNDEEVSLPERGS